MGAVREWWLRHSVWMPDGEGEVGRLIGELEHSISHLQRSNEELEAHMKEHGHDADLRSAIGENIVVIAKRKAMIEDLRKQAGLAENANVVAPPIAADPLQTGTTTVP